jgi:uncharacterized membrane protein
MPFIEHHGIALLSLFAAAGLALWFWFLRGGETRSFAGLLLATACALFAVGGLAVPAEIGMWAAAGAAVLLFLSGLIVLVSGYWSYYLGFLLAAGLAVGLGGWLEEPLSQNLAFGLRTLRYSEFGSPWWLLVLLLIPLIVWLSFHSLAGLGPFRRWLAIALRCSLILILALALAELRLRKPSENLTVLYLVDRSLSIPEDFDGNEANPIDRRWKRIKDFIAEAALKRGTGHELDQSGVIVFGRRPRLALPPSTADKLFLTDELGANIDKYYTDIGAALKLALASFPEGTSKRIILISDGNENLGNVEEQARLAKLNNVQIDVVTVAAGQRNENEVLVQHVEAPPLTEMGARLPIRVWIRSHNPRLVRGTLQLRQKASEQVTKDGKSEVIVTTTLVAIVPDPTWVESAGQTSIVILRPGLNTFSFRPTLTGDKQSYTYEAVFVPTDVAGEDGKWLKGLPGDRPQNNTASTHVVALGQRRVLFVEQDGKEGQHQMLLGQLQRSGKSKFKIAPVTTKELPTKKEELGVFLSNFDCVVLANVPAEQLTSDQMEMLRTNTYDQGCGLVMIGGPDSFGAGGWQDTAVEKALPVDCDIKSLQVTGKGGLVLTFHASEIAEGNRWQKEIGKLAVRKLAPMDMIGVNYWDFGTKWHVKFQQVAGNKSSILRDIDKMTPNDMPDCNPALRDAYDELTNPRHQLATKHIIFISDGDHWNADASLLKKMKDAGVTCTTVCITSHGQLERTKMKQIADATGGRFYAPTDASKLPAIYIQETRIVSQSFIHERPFKPVLHQTGGPASTLPADLPTLHGFVRTTKKPSALASMPIEGPTTGDQEYPVLAYWYYGLGKAVAFTSDARTGGADGKQYWDREWAQSDLYLKFWEQVIGWALRSVETGKLVMIPEYRDGKIKVTVDARDENKKPITNLKLEGAVTSPNPQANGGKPIVLDFKQKNAGQYEAEFKAEEAGSYFLNATAKQTVTEIRDGKEVLVEKTVDGVRSGVTIPYSPEFADLESNVGLMRKLAEMTGGNVYEETDPELKKIAAAATVYRQAPANARSLQPIWFWLVLLCGLGLLLDVAVRRIAVEPAAVGATLSNWWEAMRGRREAVVQTPEFLERLRSRKAEVGESIVRERARRRYEGEGAAGAPPPGADDVSALPKPTSRPQPAVPAPEAADDYAARLMKAKRKAIEDKERPGGKDG